MPVPFNNALAHVRKSIRNNKDLPPVRLSNPATEFIDHRVEISGSRKIDKPDTQCSPPPTDIAEESNFSKEVDDTSEQNHKEEDIHCKQFLEVLQSFEKDLPEKYKTRFSLRDKHDWSGVIEEASIAEIKYKKKADEKSPFGKVRGFFRKLQKKSQFIDNWLGLLPSQSQYGSLICGGIKIILRAAARMDEIKEFMVKALATIPDEVEKAQLMIDYNQGLATSPRLYSKVSSLYYLVFCVLEHIITWYGRKSATRHLKALVQQSTYEQELEEKVNDFKTAVLALKNEADLCGSLRLYNMNVDLQDLHQMVKELLLSNPRIDPKTSQPLPLEYTQPPAQKRKAISRQSLCESVLRYEENIPWEDLTSIMHRGSELNLKEQDQIVYVIESQALNNWLLNPMNAVLLIRGNSEDFDSSLSTMSCVAAHVVQSTLDVKKTRLLSLYWFAGLHRNVRSDMDANVHGIMRSFIGQLLHRYNGFDLYFIKRSTAEAMRENDLSVLCNVFDELIFQLPEKTVTFCVIDCLAHFEYHQREDVQYLVDRLRAVARHASGKGSMFKLLLTHDGGAFRAASVFDRPVEVLDVLEDGDGTRMGFNKLMWDAKVSDNINRLAIKPKRQK